MKSHTKTSDRISQGWLLIIRTAKRVREQRFSSRDLHEKYGPTAFAIYTNERLAGI